MGMLHAIKDAVLDLVFPRSCVHCGGCVEGSEYAFLCGDCLREVFWAAPPACRTCGYPFMGMLAGTRVCPHCVELAPVFDEGKALFLAKGPGRSLLHEFKYRGGFYVLGDLTRMVRGTPHFADYFADAVLVPVPLHRVKLRERGYNQSLRLAQLLAGATAARGVEDLLVRTRFTPSQTRLDRKSRHQNVKNAFAMAADAHVIADQTYILVDDVFTTGSTLNACASVLRRAGAQQIKVATLGHG